MCRYGRGRVIITVACRRVFRIGEDRLGQEKGPRKGLFASPRVRESEPPLSLLAPLRPFLQISASRPNHYTASRTLRSRFEAGGMEGWCFSTFLGGAAPPCKTTLYALSPMVEFPWLV